MSASEREVRMAAKLYQIRDTAKLLLGDRYKPKMAELGRAVKRVAADRNKTELDAATELCNGIGADGMEMLMIMAAAVELIEPSDDKRQAV